MEPEQRVENRRIGKLLIDAKVAHPQDVEKALQLQSAAGGRLGTILFRTGALSEEPARTVPYPHPATVSALRLARTPA